jgi:hypothetical protein
MSDKSHYEQTDGGWLGWMGARRTMLKGTRALAEQDVKDQRFVCLSWPHCPHRDADACRWSNRRTKR